MNSEFWELRAVARAYYNAEQNVTRHSNRIERMKELRLVLPELNDMLGSAKLAYDESRRPLLAVYRRIAPAAIQRYQKDTIGLGEAGIAQLVGTVGDFISYTEAWWEESGTTEDEDGVKVPKRVLRTGAKVSCGVRDIYAYCGMGDPALRRRRGTTQEENLRAGSPFAKRTAWLVAKTALRQNGGEDKNGKARPITPYYGAYRVAKDAKLAEGWTKGHAENHAVRVVAKCILKDIWRVQHGQDAAYGAPTPWTPRQAA